MNDIVPKEQVSMTTEVVPEDIVFPLLTTQVLENPILQKEVILEPQEEVRPQKEVIPKPQETSDLDHVASVDVPNRYELHLRITTGIPPRRYDLEFEAQRSRYQVSNESNKNLSHSAMAFNTALYSNDVPKNVEEALQDPKWKKAMEEEISTLDKNKTWEKCDLLKGKKIVRCRWVYSIKYLANRTIERCKARLVAQGYTIRHMELITLRLSLQWQNLIRSEFYSLLKQTRIGHTQI